VEGEYHTKYNHRRPWLNRPLYEDLRCPLANVPGGGTAPTWGKFRDNGAGSTGVYAWLFGNVGTPDLAFALQMPHGYKLGTDVHAHLHASPMDANAGKIKFGLEYTWAEQDGNFPTTEFIYVTVDAAGVAYRSQYLDFGDLVGTNFSTLSGMFLGRLFRDNTVGGNYASQVAGHEFDLHFELDTIGSLEELVK